MHLIGIIFVGFVSGLLARWLTPGRSPAGLLVTTALGIAGSLVATFVGQTLHWIAPGQPAGLVAATLGAVAILLIHHLIVCHD